MTYLDIFLTALTVSAGFVVVPGLGFLVAVTMKLNGGRRERKRCDKRRAEILEAKG